MWIYAQRSGELFKPDGELAGVGYSGLGPGKNNPAWQDHHDVGPIPCGTYTIDGPVDLKGGPHGPFVLVLTPARTNTMFNRSGFLLHGDSISHPGSASHGCVVQARKVRELVAASTDKQLRVIEEVDALTT